MLRHEGFTIDQSIKAFDFQPIEGREDSFVVGKITSISVEHGFKGYVVDVEHDSTPADRKQVIVPMEVSLCEFENRITLAVSEDRYEKD